MVSISAASFFAGTVFTMHAGIDKCASQTANNIQFPDQFDNHNNNNVASVEQLAQKRLLGEFDRLVTIFLLVTHASVCGLIPFLFVVHSFVM
jgi:hypothetical protein